MSVLHCRNPRKRDDMSRQTNGSIARVTLLSLLTVFLLAAACGNSDSDSEQSITSPPQPPATAQEGETPTTQASPPAAPTTQASPPAAPTTQASPPAAPTTQAPVPTVLTPDTSVAVETCAEELREFVEAAGETPTEQPMEETMRAWRDGCRNILGTWLEIANSAMNPGLGADEDCVISVLDEVLASPMTAFNELVADAMEAGGDTEAPMWGPFDRCF